MINMLEVDGLVWQAGKVFVSYCPELDVSSCGDTVEEARTNLRVAVRLFLAETERMGTLDSILKEAGFKRTRKGWQAPRLLAILKESSDDSGNTADRQRIAPRSGGAGERLVCKSLSMRYNIYGEQNYD
ncbi:MAG: hypothetical protein DDT31_00878 [Syntrophomonadaceae bacterium]|nr:hypothetical protein [Bacillota bacterium]